MSATLSWHYSLLELPLDGLTVWIRRDAWADRPRRAAFTAEPPSFTMAILSPTQQHICDLNTPAYAILCWKFQSLEDQELWLSGGGGV